MLHSWSSHLLVIPTLLSLVKARPLYQPIPSKYPFYNPEENLGANLFLAEGDILVDRRRSIEFQYYKTWYNRSVPYIFDQSFSLEEQRKVEAAMWDIQNTSCIRFKKRVNERDYVMFKVPADNGCYSPVGRTGGAQEIGLGPACFIHGIIQHEILHALGIWHEQSRRDRDKYIKVMWDNIPEEHVQNFITRSVSRSHELFLTMRYDYGSVMHYGNNTFARDRHKPTLVPLQDLPSGVVMGQRVGLSPGDIDKINALYRCDINNCTEPEPLINGHIVGSNYSVGAKVLHYCDPGFTLVGAPERVCRDLGEWSGEVPSCLPSTQSQTLVYCNFDNYTSLMCGWAQATDDELDWVHQTGPTVSQGTGPYWDHTLSTVYGSYAYVEASFTSPHQKARLVSPSIDMGTSRACLVFFANMYGSNMGNLSVYLSSPGASLTDKDLLINLQGDQGQEWKQIFLVLDTAIQPFVITMEGSIGNGFASDIAIDDIVVGNCAVFQPLALQGGLPEAVQCSFDTDLCQFIQDKRDDIDWDFNIGKTATFETGPECDPHDCLNGKYLYIESSRPRVMGNRARLRTPVIGGEGRRCLSFYYHMYGDHVGSLTVKMTNVLSGSEQILWAASGDQGNLWHSQHVDFISLDAYEIFFDGTVGPSYKGDIAIDSISVFVGRCTDSLQFDCNFEHDLCGWMNVPAPGDTLDWVRHTGETDSPDTGPSGDRTSSDGYYLYVESSRTTIGDSARIVSPTVSGTSPAHCLQFWYHMYGRSSGNLTVSYQTDTGHEELLWSQNGDQGNEWKSRSVNITNTHGHSFNIIFEATMVGFTGDVAIDDISIQNSLCGS